MCLPLVSIITPVYNGSKYLDQCVESVISQAYQNWELLLVDDGSKDQSLKKIKEWADKDSRIKVLTHIGNVNKGVSATRNLGISHSNGKYIALLDCDDVWFSEKLHKQVSILESDPELVLVYSKAIVIDDQGVPLSQSERKIKFPHIAGNGNPEKSNVFIRMLEDSIWMPTPTVIFPRQVINHVNGFVENLRYQCEDHIFFILVSHLGPVYFIDHVLAKYRIHNNSYTSNNPWQISIFETYQVINDNLPQYYPNIKELCKKKLAQLFFLYFFDTSRRKFVFEKTIVFFNYSEIQITIIKCFFKAILTIIKNLLKKIAYKLIHIIVGITH